MSRGPHKLDYVVFRPRRKAPPRRPNFPRGRVFPRRAIRLRFPRGVDDERERERESELCGFENFRSQNFAARASRKYPEMEVDFDAFAVHGFKSSFPWFLFKSRWYLKKKKMPPFFRRFSRKHAKQSKPQTRTAKKEEGIHTKSRVAIIAANEKKKTARVPWKNI